MPRNTDLNPQGGVQGTSQIYQYGATPQTRSVISQRCRILAPAFGANDVLYQVGALANLSLSESRGVEAVRSAGFGDIIAEQVPGPTEPMTASVERQLLYLSNIWQATGYAGGVSGPVRSLRHHRWPFDIRQEIVFSTIADVEFSGSVDAIAGGSGFTGGIIPVVFSGNLGGSTVEATEGVHNAILTYMEGCWWTSWSHSGISRDGALISESGDITITSVHDGTNIIGEFANTGGDPSLGQLGSQIFGNTFSG